jgi:DNA polymerase III epsilon subunit-like protein
MTEPIYTIFDTETTGLIKSSLAADDKQVRVIEFAAVHMLRDGTIVKEYETIINPGIKLTDEIKKITNITDEQVSAAKFFPEVAYEIASMLDGGNFIVAHNAMFDVQVVSMEMKRAGGIFSTFKPRKCQNIVCTIEATEFIKGKRLKLIDLYEMLFGEKFTGAHRAMTDVKALARITHQLILQEII